MSLVERILAARGFSGQDIDDFLTPEYGGHDPFLLPDMHLAVDRLVLAKKNKEKVAIYGDYDIDGLTATSLLLDALASFGFEGVESFIPNRFVEGYGLTKDAISQIIDQGADLILTVDCGSLSHAEINLANGRGVDVIVTDHHNVAEKQPAAVAVVNPKRKGHNYPFIDLAGVGVAFKLVQALQTKLSGLKPGQEKWLLDLVALGTVCDVVTLLGENRANVFWGLQVMAKTRRPGLKALMKVANVEPEKLNTRSLGFALGPRLNAAGRLETARHSLDLLKEKDPKRALEIAEQLDTINKKRRLDQDKIFKEACLQAEEMSEDNVLVLSNKDWNHGIVGIVAARILETYKKPAYVLQEMGEETKGSARSYGDFSAADAIRSADDVISKGGGHKLAAGVTLPTKNIEAFRRRVNEFYAAQKLEKQLELLLPRAELELLFDELTDEEVSGLSVLEPFGSGNPQPVVKTDAALVVDVRRMGNEGQHLKLTLETGKASIKLISFSAPKEFFVDLGQTINAWYYPEINEWNGRRSVEGRLLHIEIKG
jgi:single-stranded-DNA-specific exonuclease